MLDNNGLTHIYSQVRRIDAQIDRILLNPLVEGDDKFAVDEQDDGDTEVGTRTTVTADFSSPRVNDLLRIVKRLSTTSTAVLPATRIKDLLHESGLSNPDEQPSALEAKSQYESEVEWLLVSKATTQIYGLILNTLLDDIIPLSQDIWYWDQILSSYTYSSLYAVQTSPIRWWVWTKDIYRESTLRSTLGQRASLFSKTPQTSGDSLSQRWSRFYGIVRETVMERSLKDVQHKMFSTVSLCRSEAKQKQTQLKKLREMTASGLGVLIDEGLSFGIDEFKSDVHDSGMEWKGVVERSVALMDMVLRDVSNLDHRISEFEDKVFAGVEQDPDLSIHAEDMVSKPAVMARRLLFLLEERIPGHIAATSKVVRFNGRPSRLVRYWLPAGLLLVSSSTILRILVSRKADIVNWIRDFGTTTRDFWFNWVVQPVRKVIGTIRHDSQSEIAIMSRDSLKADRESLERMVVDFALDKPSLAGVEGPSLSEAQVADIRAKVKEGDVTPVLRAYEKDLRQPFVGAVRGDLVRSLLIQVQKTKVDLEVAISGIDALLKSQELVFGFVGLTPGILVTVAVLSYLRTALLSNRRGVARRGERVGRCVRTLRNIDRILSEATPSQNNLLSYKDHGLLVTEVHILRNLVRSGGLMPREVEGEFLEDLDDLANVKGIQIQVRALERIRWAYARWLSAH